MGLSAMLTAGRIARATKGNNDNLWAHDLASMIQVSIVGYAVGGAFLGLGYFDLLYNLVAFVIILQGLVLHEEPVKSTQRKLSSSPRHAATLGVAGSRRVRSK